MTSNERYRAALAAEDWRAAEEILRQTLSESGDPQALAMLASFLLKRGRLEETEALMATAADTAHISNVLGHLALAQYERQSLSDCENSLERLVALMPHADIGAYQLLAKLKLARLGPAGAREVMTRGRAANPGRMEFIAAYADTLPEGEAIVELQSHLPDVRGRPSYVAFILHRITTYRARMVRRAGGLPDSGISWPDTCEWPDAEALPALKEALLAEIATNPRPATARLRLASIAIAGGDWGLAERHLSEVRSGPERTPADFMAFGAALHEGLAAMSDADILAGLPAVKRLAAPPISAAETVFMASDQKYFIDYTLPFLHQLEAIQASLDVHVHLLDGDEGDWRQAHAALAALRTVSVTLTAEASGAAARGRDYARFYYHSVRYVRFFQELRRAGRPMWVLDCDTELLRDPRPLFAWSDEFDLAMRTTPAAFDPYLKVMAGCVGVAPTERGLEFARRVAAYIIHWKDRGTWGWGVDQMAIVSSYAYMNTQGRAPRTRFLDDTLVNDKVGAGGVICFLSGISKHARPGQRNEAVGAGRGDI